MSTQVTASMLDTFKNIDDGIRAYYGRRGKVYDGNFLRYIKAEEFDDPDIPIEHELGDECGPNDCSYLFDDEFPVPNDLLMTNEQKEEFIFYIVQYIYKYGHPPSDQYIKQTLVPRIDGVLLFNNYDYVYMVNQYIYPMFVDWMFGYVIGWMAVTCASWDYQIAIIGYIEDEYISDEEIELDEGDILQVQSDWESEEN